LALDEVGIFETFLAKLQLRRGSVSICPVRCAFSFHKEAISRTPDGKRLGESCSSPARFKKGQRLWFRCPDGLPVVEISRKPVLFGHPARISSSARSDRSPSFGVSSCSPPISRPRRPGSGSTWNAIPLEISRVVGGRGRKVANPALRPEALIGKMGAETTPSANPQKSHSLKHALSKGCEQWAQPCACWETG
jgi:hypothetical protein